MQALFLFSRFLGGLGTLKFVALNTLTALSPPGERADVFVTWLISELVAEGLGLQQRC